MSRRLDRRLCAKKSVIQTLFSREWITDFLLINAYYRSNRRNFCKSRLGKRGIGNVGYAIRNFNALQREAAVECVIVNRSYGIGNSCSLYELKSVEGATSDLGNTATNLYFNNVCEIIVPRSFTGIVLGHCACSADGKLQRSLALIGIGESPLNGGTMWFKAYVVSGEDNRPTTLSRVLYVELVAPEGTSRKTI